MTLRQAVEEHKLDARNVSLVETIVMDGFTQAEMARRMGISRAAIHQRIAPVRRHLRKALEIQELPAIA